MTYLQPKRLKKHNNILPESDYFYLISKGKKFIFDAEDVELISKFYWNCKNSEISYLYATNKYDTGIALHRLILGIPKGDKRIVDHINRDVLDNRKSNLRITNRAGNMMNITRPQGSNIFRGVHWNKNRNKWYVNLSYRKNGIRIHVYGGVFSDVNLARQKRIKLEKKYFKEFSPN